MNKRFHPYDEVIDIIGYMLRHYGFKPLSQNTLIHNRNKTNSEGVFILKFYIEFKEPQVKTIYCKEIQAANLEEAKILFAAQHTEGQLIKIEGRI